jgi:hypothetical protein
MERWLLSTKPSRMAQSLGAKPEQQGCLDVYPVTDTAQSVSDWVLFR